MSIMSPRCDNVLIHSRQEEKSAPLNIRCKTLISSTNLQRGNSNLYFTILFQTCRYSKMHKTVWTLIPGESRKLSPHLSQLLAEDTDERDGGSLLSPWTPCPDTSSGKDTHCRSLENRLRYVEEQGHDGDGAGDNVHLKKVILIAANKLAFMLSETGYLQTQLLKYIYILVHVWWVDSTQLWEDRGLKLTSHWG